MKRFAKYLVLILLGIVAGYLVVGITDKYSEREEAETRIKLLPDVSFTDFENQQVNLQSFDKTVSLVLVYFHPECEHCQYEAEEMGQNAGAFKNCQVVMITPDDSLKRVERFCNEYHLWELENIEILLDTNHRFKKVFGKAIIPSFYIYDKNQRLKKQFLGETKPEAILSAIENSPAAIVNP